MVMYKIDREGGVQKSYTRKLPTPSRKMKNSVYKHVFMRPRAQACPSLVCVLDKIRRQEAQ